MLEAPIYHTFVSSWSRPQKLEMQESNNHHKKNSSKSRIGKDVALRQQQEDFLAVLNHRLRTPVLASHRVIQLLLEGQFGELSAKQQELISLLAQSMEEIDRLTLMVMDICRYRSGSKALNFEYAKVEDIFNSLLRKRQKKGIELSLNISTPDMELFCDKTEITRMFNHIVDNAFKYARSRISIKLSRSKLNECVVLIEDDGKGIAIDDIGDLFERYFVVSSSGHYAPVTGAGLCLCSEIVKAHSGKISCFSSPGNGTSFELRLPFTAIQACN